MERRPKTEPKVYQPKAERPSLPEFVPGMSVQVRRLRFGGFDFDGSVMESVIQWKPAKFVRDDDGHPVVQWPDGSMETLLSRGDVR